MRIEALGHEKIRVRSPLTCEVGFRPVRALLRHGPLARHPGRARPGRGHHRGAVDRRAGYAVDHAHLPHRRHRQPRDRGVRGQGQASGQGQLRERQGRHQQSNGENVVLNRNGEIRLLGQARPRGRPLPGSGRCRRCSSRTGDDQVKAGTKLCQWDPHHVPILAEFKGKIRYEDVIEGKTLKIERDARRGTVRKQVIEHKGDLHPQLVLEDSKGQALALYPIPERAYIEVDEGVTVGPGELLAKTARDISGTEDITGGLPRVTELFEARRPKDPAVISEIDGVVELGDKKRGKRTIIVRALGDKDEVIQEQEHAVPAGQAPARPQGRRRARRRGAGRRPARAPGDPAHHGRGRPFRSTCSRRSRTSTARRASVIDDKHIEIIIGQMMRKVEVKDPGDSEFLPGAVVDRFRFRTENEQPAQGAQEALDRTDAAARHHQGIALVRVVHLGRQLPGDHQGLDRSGHRRPPRLPGRAEGERDPRSHGARPGPASGITTALA